MHGMSVAGGLPNFRRFRRGASPGPALDLVRHTDCRFPVMTELLGTPSAFDVLPAPITVLVGHFGAGKTEIAVNLAFGWRARGAQVSLVDLDLVKPYFRSRLLRDDLTARGIDLVAPQGEHFYADLPILLPEVRGAVSLAAGGRRRAILDVGGADVGSRVLGALAGLSDPALTDVLFVVNGNRPFAEDAPAVLRMLRDIEKVSRLRVTGLIANTHLMEETTPAIVEAGLDLAEHVSRASQLPVRFWAVLARIAETATNGFTRHRWPMLPLTRLITAPLEMRASGPNRRSSVV
ncbi:MAG: cobalamin biosynthesis protein CbiA [Acidobacteriota bacterium]